jgi:uncharacterized protein (TIGR02270 family)
VLTQYVEGAAALWNRRGSLVRARGTGLKRLQIEDARLEAHLEGLRLGGARASEALTGAFSSLGFGEVFPAAILALERRDVGMFDQVAAVVRAMRELEPALVAAVGWIEPAVLQGVVREWRQGDTFWQRLAIAACGKHRVNPGGWLTESLQSDEPAIAAAAARVAGEVGAIGLTRLLVTLTESQDAACRYWSARSAALTGDRGVSYAILGSLAAASTFPDRAFDFALQILDPSQGHKLLRSLAGDPANGRRLYRGAGVVGDSHYVPWLLKQMQDPRTARAAGEAFALITGIDLTASGLDRPAPEKLKSAAADVADDDGDDDEDDGLVWPDPERIAVWWSKNEGRFPAGTRCFMGAPVTREHCIEVLKNGYQRQRILAAHYLCLLEPGTPLFNSSAPAWRQQRLLAEMK